ncbi:hypothetical protein [Listeria fleischmannii]|uniref:hypothetical protein n=1 Tax=Listeria fleischmannii TaxID=1069827 RepID=UPI00210036C0|nr:hypothetical protein [Listeria fleischmannii]
MKYLGKVARLKKTLFLSILFILLALLVLFVVWNVQADEVTPNQNEADLIASNRVWIESKTPIPLTNDISVTPFEKNTDVEILKNGNLVVEVTNAKLLKQLALENSIYDGIKAYRLVITAPNVAEYINNAKFKYPMDHAYTGISNYQIESGTRSIETGSDAIRLTRENNQVHTKSTVQVRFSDDLAKDSMDALQMNVSSNSLALDDSFQTKAKSVRAFSKELFYDFNVTKNSWLILSSSKQVHVYSPVGMEYIMK